MQELHLVPLVSPGLLSRPTGVSLPASCAGRRGRPLCSIPALPSPPEPPGHRRPLKVPVRCKSSTKRKVPPPPSRAPSEGGCDLDHGVVTLCPGGGHGGRRLRRHQTPLQRRQQRRRRPGGRASIRPRRCGRVQRPPVPPGGQLLSLSTSAAGRGLVEPEPSAP